MKSYLEFERGIKGLEEELEKLKDPFNKEGLSEVETNKINKHKMYQSSECVYVSVSVSVHYILYLFLKQFCL